ncbi:MAG TPA: glycosyltransferase [Pirellulales bacterium]|nr:glycosyltransferase [Pirellulales bacterium]
MSTDRKPKLLWLRFLQPKLPSFVQLHMREQERCMSQYFDLTLVNERSCDYQQLCDQHEPDLAIFETGVYTVQAEVKNTDYSPQVPKLGFVHCDAYCPTRKTAIANMANWGVAGYFGISVSMAEYTPSIAGDMFVWPNFVTPEVFRDYGLAKVVPILFTGSQATHYPWRSRIARIVSRHYPTLHSPHFGWCWKKAKPRTSGFLEGVKYAQLLNSSYIAPTCGTIANEVVRKHFEIPACNSCLLTEKTPGLEAAGFRDMVNCVYTDENDVLDKLEWLFEHPEELARITAAGKALVDSRHTIHHRNQVFDWFNLHRRLKPGQRVVQPGPFEPMRISEIASGEANRHAAANAVDGALLAAGNQRLRAGDYAEAERLYRAGLNYHQPPILDHKFALVKCQLHQGKSAEALATMREHFPSHQSTSEQGFEPDPTEWAWFLVTLLCHGNRREAALRAAQFPHVRNAELDRARQAVAAACQQSSFVASNDTLPQERPTVHRTPCAPPEEWTASLRTMLVACGQQGLAELQTGTSMPRPVEKMQLPASTPAKSKQKLPVSQTLLYHSLNAQSRLARRGKKLQDRWHRVVQKVQHALYTPAPDPFAADAAEMIRLLTREEIGCGVLVGAAQGSWLSEAFMRAMTASPHRPPVICVNRSTDGFATFHRQHAHESGVEFRYLPSDGTATLEGGEASGLLVIEQPDLLENPGQTCAAAQLIVVRQILSAAGHACHHALTAGETHDLVMHEPAASHQYAIFRRATGGACASAVPLRRAA